MKNSKHPPICLDTNIFIRIFSDEDTEESRLSKELIKEIINGRYKAIITGVVIAEVLWVLKSFYKLSKIQQLEAINSMQSMPNAQISDKYHWGMASSFYEMFKVKFTDAVLLSVVGINKEPVVLVTFDEELLKLKVQGLNIVHPRELV